jgi:carboxyl-terminal processing protease
MAGNLPVVTSVGVPRTFSIRTVAGQERTIQVASEDFALTPVMEVQTYSVARTDGSTARVGYLLYHQFVGYGAAAVQSAFDRFRAEGVTEVVLDLRYNGGGSVPVARDVAAQIGGMATASRVFTTLRFNSQNQGSNQSFVFPPTALAGMQRAIVIASNETASASELLINGLKPHMPVVLVGQTTFGKPYGFVPRDDCGTTFNAVQFDAVNSLGEGGFTSGFAPQCAVADDLSRPLGDPQERRLRAALSFVGTGQCGPLAAPSKSRVLPAGETSPPGMHP